MKTSRMKTRMNRDMADMCQRRREVITEYAIKKRVWARDQRHHRLLARGMRLVRIYPTPSGEDYAFYVSKDGDVRSRLPVTVTYGPVNTPPH